MNGDSEIGHIYENQLHPDSDWMKRFNLDPSYSHSMKQTWEQTLARYRLHKLRWINVISNSQTRWTKDKQSLDETTYNQLQLDSSHFRQMQFNDSFSLRSVEDSSTPSQLVHAIDDAWDGLIAVLHD